MLKDAQSWVPVMVVRKDPYKLAHAEMVPASLVQWQYSRPPFRSRRFDSGLQEYPQAEEEYDEGMRPPSYGGTGGGAHSCRCVGALAFFLRKKNAAFYG